MTPHVSVWPSPYVPGWDGASDLPPMWPVVPLVYALLDEHPTDAHASPVVVYGADGELAEALPRLRGSALDVLDADGARVVLESIWIDLDRHAHAPWAEGELEDSLVEDLLSWAAGRAGVIPYIYTTRAGARLVWGLAEPIPARLASSWLVQWLEVLGQPPAELGLEVDPRSAEWSRCYRLPHVVRDGAQTRPHHHIPAYPAFLDWTPPRGLTPGRTRAPSIPPAAQLDPDRLTRIDDLAGEGAVIDALRGVQGIPWDALKRGTPYAPAGGRDTTLTHGLGVTVDAIIARGIGAPAHTGGRSRDDLVEAVAELALSAWYDSILATIAADPAEAPPLAKAWTLALGFAAHDLDERGGRWVRPMPAPPRAGYGGTMSHATPPHAPPHALGGPAASQAAMDTPHEVARPTGPPQATDGPPSAQPQGVQVPALPGGPAIIVWGSRYLVRDEVSGSYGPLVSGTALASECLRSAPSLAIRTSKGKVIADRDIVAEYGVVAESVVYHYSLPDDRDDAPSDVPRGAASWWDESRRELHRATCIPRQTPARRSEAVAAWLQALAPDPSTHEALLDWLATSADLDRPTSALYLRAGEGVGKTLLARGVAAQWGDVIVSYAEAAGQFTAGLLESPVVHLSEGVEDARSTSAVFRSLTGDRMHRLDKKHVDPLMLIGHPRLVVGANNDEALPLGEGHHTRDDLGALLQRVLYLRGGEDARRVLLEQGADALAEWGVPGGVIPRHIAWLRAQRGARVRRDAGRWLVAGRDSSWHRGLLLRSGANEGVLVAICEALRPALAGQTSTAAVIHGGRAWVNVSAIYPLTAQAMGGRAISRAYLARTVRDLSPDESSTVLRIGAGREGRQIRAWPISGDVLVMVAEAHGMDHADALRGALQPNPQETTP